MPTFSPFVYWAQNETNIFIKIDLKDVKDPVIGIGNRKLHFHSKGSGAQGFKDYEFYVDFYSEVEDGHNNNIKITDHKVELNLRKIENSWWPRLTSQPQKPAWLKIDFDRWVSEEDLADEDVRDVREDYPELYKRLQAEEIGYMKEDFKKGYMMLYNVFMLVGFLYVASVLSIKYLKDGADFYPQTYSTLAGTLNVLQFMQFLEVVHCLVGYTKGNWFTAFTQVFGRNFLLLSCYKLEPKEQQSSVVFYLFLTWSLVELIRYPFYLSQLFKKENTILTWLRYTVWVVLYPIGFTCEGIILFYLLLLADRTGLWSVTLPNAWNFTFHFATVLRIMILFLYIPGCVSLLSYMYRARKQKMGRSTVSSKTKIP